MATTDASVDEGLVKSVTEYVKAYMANYDGSHDFNHIRRVLGLARYIHTQSPNTSTPPRDPQVVVLGALLHDVGDKKYLKPGEDASTLVRDLLTSLGASSELAEKVQTVCLGVSYSSEIKDPARVQDLIKTHPELAVVQDADRLDAIGSIGIGRVFTFTGARTQASMDNSIQHFHDKLLRLEGMMKTDVGRRLARERTERMHEFLKWWGEEAAFSTTSSDELPPSIA
ncbi:HD domain-containing protein [Xylariomycetidae sp. FL2044]|nr:HD domain-containing protein [Xylariomycetidae sp. FL2044]